MALVLADRVQETTTTTGTGTITLAGAVSGYQPFAVIGDGNTTYYTVTSGTAWEVGLGTYSAGTLARTTIFASSASGAAITLAGTSTVFLTYPSERAVAFDSAGNSNLLGVNNIDYGYQTIATAAGTTTLTVASPYYIYFTGATTQTLVMPVTSTLALGWSYHIANNSTGNITIQSSGLNAIGTILPGTTVHITCIDTTVTSAAGWDFGYTDFGTATGTGSVALSASPTFTGTVQAAALTTSGTLLCNAGLTVQVGTLGTSGASAVSFTGTSAITIGSTSSTSTILIGASSLTQTLNLANGTTSTGNTKTVNIGANGASGSTTNITIGSATSGAATNIITYGNIGVGGANYGTSGQVLTSAGSGAAPTWSTPSGTSQAKATALSMILGF